MCYSYSHSPNTIAPRGRTSDLPVAGAADLACQPPDPRFDRRRFDLSMNEPDDTESADDVDRGRSEPGVEEVGDGRLRDRFVPTSAGVGVAAFLTAAVSGLAGYAALFVLWDSLALFVLVFVPTFAYLSQLDRPAQAVGTGLYVTAALIMTFPLVLLVLFLASLGSGPIGGMRLGGGILAIVALGAVSLAVAVPVAGVGYVFNRLTSGASESGGD